LILKLEELSPRDRYAWMIGTIIPRPIAFVSSVDGQGRPNLAPFSYFNGVSSDPPVLSVAVGTLRGGVPKDTTLNIEATGEFVVNVVSEAIGEQMVMTSGEYEPGESEFAISGLTPVASTVVRPPRVLESPVAFECRLLQIVKVGSPATSLILGEVVLMHVADEVITDGRPDPLKIQPLARLGGDWYAGLGEMRAIPRPKVRRELKTRNQETN
jgi:flavin reductase (DIM6/NTAB) family NADH-FMN oxidoreductase RutF